jgi:NAD+ kinase
MPKSSPAPTHISVAAHPDLPDALAECQAIADFLADRGVQTISGSLYDETLRQQIQKGCCDALIALGGDGTMLRAVHLCAPLDIPILGINLGHFGFLMEVKANQWRETLPRLMSGEYWLEQRMMLTAEHWRGNTLKATWEALNEVVVTRGQLVRPVQLIANVDGHVLATYVADALIAATATGSTAYALAAGGPVLPPEMRNILVVPVAPHLSISHSVLLSEGMSVTITVHTDHQAVVSIDGQPPLPMLDGDRVKVFPGKHDARFVRFQDPGYFYRDLTSHMERNLTPENLK